MTNDERAERMAFYERVDAELEASRQALCEAFGPKSSDARVWDLYAAHALGGLMARSAGLGSSFKHVSGVAAEFADALLAERRRRMGQVAGGGKTSSDVSTGTAGGKDV